MLKRLLLKKRYVVTFGILIAIFPLFCLALFIKFSIINDLQQNAIRQRETFAVAAAQILTERLEGEIVYGNAFVSRYPLQQAVATHSRPAMPCASPAF